MKVRSNLYKHGEGSEKLKKVLFYLELSGEEAGKSYQPCLAAHSQLKGGFIRSKTNLTTMLGAALTGKKGRCDSNPWFAPEL